MMSSLIVQDITTDEFVRKYALLITSKDILQFGLLLALGDSEAQAKRHSGIANTGRTEVAVTELKRLGYIVGIEKHGTG
jgi:hypothetical protein